REAIDAGVGWLFENIVGVLQRP
ncbi:MAG: hypothetical protein RLY21_1022, partial [Planctomycetota bacterium]